MIKLNMFLRFAEYIGYKSGLVLCLECHDNWRTNSQPAQFILKRPIKPGYTTKTFCGNSIFKFLL